MKRAMLLLLAGILFAACGTTLGAPCSVSPTDFPCHTAIVTGNGPTGDLCEVFTVDDGQPCRVGVGICSAGNCIRPTGTPDVCMGPALGIDEDICNANGDCHGANVCADYSCPSPGQDACLILPKPDGSLCAAGLACLHGLCCMPVSDAACADDSGCRATEECTVATCGSDGVCSFTRSDLGAACETSGGTPGRCVKNSGDVVPRCHPVG